MGKNRWRTVRGIKNGQHLRAERERTAFATAIQPNSIMPYTAGSTSSARKPPIGASLSVR